MNSAATAFLSPSRQARFYEATNRITVIAVQAPPRLPPRLPILVVNLWRFSATSSISGRLQRTIPEQDKETTVDSTDTPTVPADETNDAPAVPIVETAAPTHSSGLIRLLAIAVIVAGII